MFTGKRIIQCLILHKHTLINLTAEVTEETIILVIAAQVYYVPIAAANVWEET